MKKFFEEWGALSLGIVTLVCLLWSFFLGGIEVLVSNFTADQALGALFVIVGLIVFLFVRKLIASIKWWKASDTWRVTLKKGDVAYVSTHDGHEDGEILDIEDQHVTVKIRVHKSRIYKPY